MVTMTDLALTVSKINHLLLSSAISRGSRNARLAIMLRTGYGKVGVSLLTPAGNEGRDLSPLLSKRECGYFLAGIHSLLSEIV